MVDVLVRLLLLSIILTFSGILCVQHILPRFFRRDVCPMDGSFLTFTQITASECFYECYFRSSCIFLSYHVIVHVCFLHDDDISQRDNLTLIKECVSLNMTEIQSLAETGKCGDRPCPKTTKCVPDRRTARGFECEPSHCLQPAVFSNTSIRNSVVKAGKITSYFCHEGYTMIGSPEAICTEESTWSYGNFKCYKTCALPDLPNATITMMSTLRLSVNSSVTFKCNTGYYNITPLITTCGSNGEWADLADIKCLKHCVSEPPTVAGATFYISTAEPYTIFTVVQYSCLNSYYHVGSPNSLISCSESGAWTSPTLACFRYCGALPQVPHADRISTPQSPYTIISYARYECDWGYSFNGQHQAIVTIYCNEQGEWNPEVHCCVGNEAYWDDSRNRCCYKFCIFGACIKC